MTTFPMPGLVATLCGETGDGCYKMLGLDHEKLNNVKLTAND